VLTKKPCALLSAVIECYVGHRVNDRPRKANTSQQSNLHNKQLKELSPQNQSKQKQERIDTKGDRLAKMPAAIVSGARSVIKPNIVTQFTLLNRKQKALESECAAHAKRLCMHKQESAVISKTVLLGMPRSQVRILFGMPLSFLGTLFVRLFPVLPSGIVSIGPQTKCIKRVDSESESFVVACSMG
jgi:hypothetical protein